MEKLIQQRSRMDKLDEFAKMMTTLMKGKTTEAIIRGATSSQISMTVIGESIPVTGNRNNKTEPTNSGVQIQAVTVDDLQLSAKKVELPSFTGQDPVA